MHSSQTHMYPTQREFDAKTLQVTLNQGQFFFVKSWQPPLRNTILLFWETNFQAWIQFQVKNYESLKESLF